MKIPDVSQAVKASGGVGGAAVSSLIVMYAAFVQPAVNAVQYDVASMKNQVQEMRSTVSDLDRALMVMSMTCGRDSRARASGAFPENFEPPTTVGFYDPSEFLFSEEEDADVPDP